MKAKDIEKKFNKGEDITRYLDVSKASFMPQRTLPMDNVCVIMI